jgi:N-acetylglucosaminyldiphosphoundecaprenol N-acetyl-beta-D-mannosaminyltransferase
MTHPHVDILGVEVSAIDMELALSTFDEWISTGVSQYVCVRDVHGIVRCQRDEELRSIHRRAGMVTPDGMPIVFLARLLGHPETQRVYGPDLLLAACRRSEDTGWRHYFYGGGPGVPELLAERLQQRFPRLAVVGTYSPPFRDLTDEEDEELCDAIRAARPDIVWVGLGTPKQERWMASHVGRVGNSVLVGVGAAFDFHSGTKKQAPRWMQRSALEWLFRLLHEPRRLGRRYLVGNPLFLILVARQFVAGRPRKLDREPPTNE